MTEPDIIEAWAERASILEYDGLPDRQRRDQPPGLYRTNCERRAYIMVRRQYGIDRMPAATYGWAGNQQSGAV